MDTWGRDQDTGPAAYVGLGAVYVAIGIWGSDQAMGVAAGIWVGNAAGHVPVAQGDRAGGHVPVAQGDRAGPHVPVEQGDMAEGRAENQVPGREVAAGRAVKGAEWGDGRVMVVGMVVNGDGKDTGGHGAVGVIVRGNVVGIVEEYDGHADATENVGNDESVMVDVTGTDTGRNPGNAAKLAGSVYPGKPAEENIGGVAVAVLKEVVGKPKGSENEGNIGNVDTIGAPNPYPAGKAVEKSGAARLRAVVSVVEGKAGGWGMVGKMGVGKVDSSGVMGTGPDSVRVRVGLG